MATLTNDNFTKIKELAKSDPATWDVFRTWGLSKATWQALFQAIEDWFINGFATQPASSLKASIDAVVGSSTATQAKRATLTWIKWRFGEDL